MKVLCFIPYDRLESEVVEAVCRQERVERFSIWLEHDNPFTGEVKGGYKNIQYAYERMRQIVLRDNYDAVWIVESDTVPPLDALSKLLEIDAPVVSGLYALRHGEPVPNIRNHNGAWAWASIAQHWGETVEITGGCMGCLLIRREVLENFTMISNDDLRAPDGRFMAYCIEQRIKQMARLDVVCQHIRPNGEILIPTGDVKGYRIEEREPVYA